MPNDHEKVGPSEILRLKAAFDFWVAIGNSELAEAFHNKLIDAEIARQ